MECWKTLVRYVLFNARDLTSCCAYFGRACLAVDPATYRPILTANEHKALHAHQHGSRRWRNAWHLLGMPHGEINNPEFQAQQAVTELAELLGEGDETGPRKIALGTILRAAWIDIETKRRASALHEAFRNFVAMASQDSGLCSWVSQVQFAQAFGQTKAAFSARIRRKVKAPLRAAGAKGLTVAGGLSERACIMHSIGKMGNKCKSKANGKGKE